jgi:hypothetical protein
VSIGSADNTYFSYAQHRLEVLSIL